MTKGSLPDEELTKLDRLAHATITYLVITSLASFFAGAYVLKATELDNLIAVAFLGFSGSAVAALTSALDRYAIGFERENGKPFPESAKEGTGKFSRRFARWFFARPFLGAVIAPAFVWGLSHFARDPKEFLESKELLGFTAFMGGLLAKSVVDLIKGLFKNVFKV